MTIHNHGFRKAAVVALSFIIALFFLAAANTSHPATGHDDHATHRVAPAIAHVDLERQAHHDMEVYAAIYFGNFKEVPNTFGGADNWHPDWELHWMEVEHDGDYAIVYHLASKHDDGHRLVNVRESADQNWSGWDALH